MIKKASKYPILLLLAALFAAPGIFAYVFYQHPNWLGTKRVNKGTLLNPAVAIQALDTQSKWRLLYWSPKICSKACLAQLDTLARVRLALGRKLYYVDQWLLLGESAPALNELERGLVRSQGFHIALNAQTKLPAAMLPEDHGLIYLVDPNNYVILSYKVDVNPNDIFKDLKRLLDANANKSG